MELQKSLPGVNFAKMKRDKNTERQIFDWGICDCFCMRVLGATIKNNGKECAEAIASWKNAQYLWQARSSVTLLKRKYGINIPKKLEHLLSF